MYCTLDGIDFSFVNWVGLEFTTEQLKGVGELSLLRH